MGSTMKPRIQYARSADGARIAYWALGSGPAFVHLTPGTTDIEGEWEIPECRRWYEQLASRWTLVRYNTRGEGHSDYLISDNILEDHVTDIEAVMDAATADRCVLFGTWYGGPVAITYAVRHPERVSHLILLNTFASGSQWSRQAEMVAASSLVDKDWITFTEAVAHVILGWSEGEPARRYAEILRKGNTAEYTHNFYAQVNRWDVSPLLEMVAVPTLVLHRRQHTLGLDVARGLAKEIPNSTLVILEGSSMVPYLGDTGALLGAIEEFTATAGAPDGQGTGLTGREIEVLRLVAAGRSNREISEELSISINTVDRHVSNILVKIGASNRAEAASFAVRRRLA